MSALAALLACLSRKPPEVRADFVGHLAFNVLDELNEQAWPPDMRADLDRFIERAGFEVEDSAEQTRARLDAHFQAHAVDAELLRLFDALEADISAREAAGAADQARAASAALGHADSLKPVGAEGRKPGTLAGGLAGLVAARTAKPTPAPAAAQAPVTATRNPAPPAPNAPFAR